MVRALRWLALALAWVSRADDDPCKHHKDALATASLEKQELAASHRALADAHAEEKAALADAHAAATTTCGRLAARGALGGGTSRAARSAPRAARSIVSAMLWLVVKKFQELLASRALVQLCIGESNLEVYGSLKSLATVLATLVSAGRFFPPRS